MKNPACAGFFVFVLILKTGNDPAVQRLVYEVRKLDLV